MTNFAGRIDFHGLPDVVKLVCGQDNEHQK